MRIHPSKKRNYRRGIAPLVLLFASLVTFVLFVSPAGASKIHLFQERFGSAVKQEFSNTGVGGLAVDPSSGDLLVIDAGTDTLSRFHSDGTPHPFAALGTHVIDAKGEGDCATVPADCDQTPQNGFIFGFFAGEQQVAVDHSGTVTDGNIYVTQPYDLAGKLVDIFAADGSYLGQLTGAGATKFGTTTGSFSFSPPGVAVDLAGNVYIAGGSDSKIYKFDPAVNPPVNADIAAIFPTGEPVRSLGLGAGPSAGSLFASTTGEINSVLRFDSTTGMEKGVIEPGKGVEVSVDSVTGHLYVSSIRPGPLAIREYDGSTLVSSTLITANDSRAGIAIDGVSGRMYIGHGSVISIYGPLVTTPDVTSGNAQITGDTSASLEGSVDPDGEPLEECKFEYGLTLSYGTTIPCIETVGEIGTTVKTVHAEIGGLTAESLYHYRLVARNANDTVEGKDKTFRTPGKPRIAGIWSIDVGLREAILKAQINPENSQASYRFEWGHDASYGNVTADVAIGAGESDRIATLPLSGLEPGATYHYRVVAENSIGVSEATDHTFTTYPVTPAAKSDCSNQAFRTGPSATLPDCRAFEMVSPVDKNGGDVKVLGNASSYPARLDQSADDGSRFSFSSIAAFAGALGAPWSSQYLSTRGAGGWRTEAINPPRELPSFSENNFLKLDVLYKALSADLSSGWLVHESKPSLDPCGVAGFPNLLRRDNDTGRYEAVTTAEPLDRAPDQYIFEVQGTSVDGSRTVFRANAKLTEDAASNDNLQIYEHVQTGGCGELRLVSVLPNGTPSNTGSVGGQSFGTIEARANRTAQAVSNDGSRIYWTAPNPNGGDTPLYVRIDGQETFRIAPSGLFWNASSDGSKAIYTVQDKVTFKNKMFQFDLDSRTSTLLADNVLGVAGVSEDASRIYFVSTEQLGGEGDEGESNLYLYEDGGGTSLVATLNGNDPTLGPGGDLSPNFLFNGFSVAVQQPLVNGVRLTADGGHLAFVSTGKLTGYDNTDAVDGRPNLEIYLYDATADDLRCVSCNPSGARPRGRAFGPQDGKTRRVAAMMPPGENQNFAPRALSSDGDNLFFESFEALLPRDVNGKADVYQWQRAAGPAQCREAGAELYVPSAGGCLSLVSTGQSPIDTEIADVTPDGSSVFIRTASSLLLQDPGQVDVYVARVNGGFPQSPAPPAACEGEACQGPLAAPNSPTPASSAFHGPGNVDEGKPKPRACSKGKVRRKGKCVPKKPAGKHKDRRNGKSGQRASAHRRQG